MKRYVTMLKAAARAAERGAWIAAATLKRPLLRRTVFIGVTGSAGKTTTKDMIASALAPHLRGRATPFTANDTIDIARLVCRTGLDDRYCIAELAIMHRGQYAPVVRLTRPDIGVVTTIGDDHIAAYGTREAIADEKAKVVDALPATGTAVLNADDPLVLAMRSRCRGRVVTYGRSEGADFRAVEVHAGWPERLRVRVAHEGREVDVATQFVGEHWLPCVLAALATSVVVGVPLEAAAAGVAACKPSRGRMQPCRTAAGIDILRDDWKAPLWSFGKALDVLGAAAVPRRIVVVGSVSDETTWQRKQYGEVARRTLAASDKVIVVGPWAASTFRAIPPDRADDVRAFASLRPAFEHLRRIARPGDLVLLKGTNRQDHLERIVFAFDHDIGCWGNECRRHSFCVGCAQLALRPRSAGDDGEADGPSTTAASAPAPAEAAPHLVVGLGNPDAGLRDTPHNAGHMVVDRLVASLGLGWEDAGPAWIARVAAPEPGIVLVKLKCRMNDSGDALLDLLRERRWSARNCILVHDDKDFPLGRTKARMRGSAGGHRGVASVLDALQTDLVRRVKVGVGRDGAASASEFVLSPIAAADRPLLERAIAEAATKVLALGPKVVA